MPKASKTKSKKRRPSDCKNSKNGDCKGKYKLQYEDNAPTFICNKCGDVELTWKKFYTEYLQLYREKDNWDAEKHKITCIIETSMEQNMCSFRKIQIHMVVKSVRMLGNY